MFIIPLSLLGLIRLDVLLARHFMACEHDRNHSGGPLGLGLGPTLLWDVETGRASSRAE